MTIEKPLNSTTVLPEITNQKEEGFPTFRYLIVALAAGAAAAAIFELCLPAAIAMMVVSGWYLWSATIIPLNRMAQGSSIGPAIHHLHAMAMEVNSGIVSAALFPLTLFDRYHGPVGNPNGRPILMLNGYLSFGSTWHYQRQKLVDAGFGPIYTMNVGTGKSIKTYAKQVQQKVQEIQKETGRDDLDLVGHSKGGLVGSYFATHLSLETKTKVIHVVTIASPLKGTKVAHVGPGYDAGEMRMDSPFHAELRQKIQEHPEIRFFHIGSKADAVVPASSAVIGEDPSRQMVLEDMGHLGLVFSSRVADQVCTWLKV